MLSRTLSFPEKRHGCTRLAGYKAELFIIKHGLQTMGGYTHGAAAAGAIIDTSH